MAPKKQGGIQNKEVEKEKTEEKEPMKVLIYDGGAMKTAVDDAASAVILDAGYEEEVSVSNVKIILGFIAICLSAYSQFGPGKFPGTYYTILCCVFGYGVVTALLHLYADRYEGRSFLITKPSKDGATSCLRLSSHVDKFGEDYSLEITEGAPGEAPTRSVSRKWGFGELFHSDGYLAEDAVKERVLLLLQDLSKKAQGSYKKENVGIMSSLFTKKWL